MADEPLEKIETKKPKAAAEPQVTISMPELMSMFKSVMEASQQQATKATEGVLKELADAIKESRKPWVDPKQEENDKMMREQMRETQKRIAERIAYSQKNCPHKQGSNELSDFQGALSSIIWHQTDTTTIFGICTNCLREFWPEQEDYNYWRNQKSGNRMSRAGQRMFMDPRAAAAAGR